MLTRAIAILAFAWPLAALAQPRAPITLDSLLAEMTDRESIARFPDPPYTCKQFSSYDRASTTPDDPKTWFANNDFSQFLRTEENGVRKEWVMADMDGPGAVVRIWSANPKGTMRVYLDGDAKPVIEAPMADILGGKWKIGESGAALGEPLSGVRSRGYNLYLPIPYATHCKITSDSDGFYYQVNYRVHAPGTHMRSLSRANLSDAARRVIATGKELLKRREISRFSIAIDRDWKGIQQGEESELGTRNNWGTNKLEAYAEPSFPGAVTDLYLFLEQPATDQDLRSVVLIAEFDGEQTIWVPLSDFFGIGASAATQFQDFYRATTEKAFRSDWVMPFKSSMKIKLKNYGANPVFVWGMACLDKWSWDSRSMHFHANWRAQYPIHTTAGKGAADWNYLTATGKGVYVGDSLAVMNPVEQWWGEGDEKIYVDGETFPSHFGTGTEDYYGYAWCDSNTFQHPFHAQPRADGKGKHNWGHSTVSRVRALDAIPFTKSFRFDMEIWHWATCDVAYAATTCWYALPGATCNIAPDPDSAKAPIPQPPPLPPPFTIAGAIECETMPIAAKSEGLTAIPQDMTGFARRTFSGETHLWVQARKLGDLIELTIKPDAAPGSAPSTPRRLTLHATKSWDYGIIRFTINGQPAGPDNGAPIDLFSSEKKVKPTGPIDLGTFTPRPDGTFLLRAEVTGGNPKAEGSRAFFGLDCIIATPASR